MTTYYVPVRNDETNRDMTAVFDNTTLSINFRYNERNDCWYMTIRDLNNNTLLSGIPLLSNIENMTRPYAVLPSGIIGDWILFDTQNGRLDCTLENFGTIVEMFYVSA